MTALADAIGKLRDQVTANTNLLESAKTLVKGLADRIQAAAESDDATTELTNLCIELRGKDEDFAQAIAANTPAAPVLGLASQQPASAATTATTAPDTGAAQQPAS